MKNISRHDPISYSFLDFIKYTFINNFVDKSLHAAAKTGNLKELNNLLVMPVNLNEYDELGYTPLHHAVANNNLECVKRLLEAGANPDAITHNRSKSTALHLAVYSKSKLIIKLLLNHGADYSTIKDSEGNTARKAASYVDDINTYFEEAIKEKNNPENPSSMKMKTL